MGKERVSNPNGTLWLQGDAKFGKKLLEKFGWSEGKGLGKKEDGDVSFIKVRKNYENTG